MFIPKEFTEKARTVILLAREEAKRLDHLYIGTEHILLGLIREGDGLGATVLKQLGTDLTSVRQKVEEIVGRGGAGMFLGDMPYSPGAKRILNQAITEAKQLGHSSVRTGHILLALTEGIGTQVLSSLGLNLVRIRGKVEKNINGQLGLEDEL